jgi:hypothetical protein
VRIDSNSRIVNDFDTKKVQEQPQKVEINKSFETEMADGVKSDIKAGSVTPAVEEIKSANTALAHLSKVGGAMKQLSGDKMESAMADMRNITNSLKDMLNKNLTAINEPTNAVYSNDEMKSKLSSQDFVNSHNFDYLASKADALLA